MFKKNRELVNSISTLDEREKEFLYSALNIHGHVCGGMALGYVAGLSALKKLEISRERNMDTFVIVNTGKGHAAGCFSDGIQLSTGCTFGKGIFLREEKGKWTFLMVNKKLKKGVRVSLKGGILEKAFASPFMDYRKKGVVPTDVPEEVSHSIFKNIFSMESSEILEVGEPFDFEVKSKKPCFNIVRCERCKSIVAENYILVEDGKFVCVDCLNYGK